MNCGAIRERLPERALGTLDAPDDEALDRHLVWCAACRKEARELSHAAATLAFALAPVEPPPELEGRVVEAIRDVTAPGTIPRRGRLAVALAVAAMIAISGLGWGAVMAGRAARFAETAAVQRQRTADALRRFSEYLDSSEFNAPGNQVFVGKLTATTRRGTAAGSALTLVSAVDADVAIVMVSGLRASPNGVLPLRVILTTERGQTLSVGRITTLDAGGNAIVVRRFVLDLSRYSGVQVMERSGAVVLRGSLHLRTTSATPSP